MYGELGSRGTGIAGCEVLRYDRTDVTEGALQMRHCVNDVWDGRRPFRVEDWYGRQLSMQSL